MKNSEYVEQCKLVQYLTLLKNQNKIITFWATINENNTSATNRHFAIINENKLKRQGKRAGVSDIFVLTKDKLIAIEMKKAPKVLKSGKLSYTGITVSDYQKAFLEDLNNSDVAIGKVCYGFNEAKDFIDMQIGV